MVPDETTKVNRATAFVKSTSVNCVELLIVGATVVRRWQTELKEGQGRDVEAGRRDNDRK